MPTVAVLCRNRFHDEVEGSESTVITTTSVDGREELDALLDRGVEIHGRCYCGHSTMITKANALLVDNAPGQ